MPTSGTLPLKVFRIPEFVFSLWRFCVCALYRPSLYRFWYYCRCSLNEWVCGSLVSHLPFPWMFPLGVSWWVSYFLFFPTWWELCTFGSALLRLLFLFDQGSDQGTCSDFFWSEFRSGYLSRIFVHDLPSHSLLLSLKIMMENSLFSLLPLNIKSLATITSRKYSLVDVDLDKKMASSKLH